MQSLLLQFLRNQVVIVAVAVAVIAELVIVLLVAEIVIFVIVVERVVQVVVVNSVKAETETVVVDVNALRVVVLAVEIARYVGVREMYKY